MPLNIRSIGLPLYVMQWAGKTTLWSAALVAALVRWIQSGDSRRSPKAHAVRRLRACHPPPYVSAREITTSCMQVYRQLINLYLVSDKGPRTNGQGQGDGSSVGGVAESAGGAPRSAVSEDRQTARIVCRKERRQRRSGRSSAARGTPRNCPHGNQR